MLLVGRARLNCAFKVPGFDRAGALEVFRQLAREAPELRHVLAGGRFLRWLCGPKIRETLTCVVRWLIQIAKRFDTTQGVAVRPLR